MNVASRKNLHIVRPIVWMAKYSPLEQLIFSAAIPTHNVPSHSASVRHCVSDTIRALLHCKASSFLQHRATPSRSFGVCATLHSSAAPSACVLSQKQYAYSKTYYQGRSPVSQCLMCRSSHLTKAFFHNALSLQKWLGRASHITKQLDKLTYFDVFTKTVFPRELVKTVYCFGMPIRVCRNYLPNNRRWIEAVILWKPNPRLLKIRAQTETTCRLIYVRDSNVLVIINSAGNSTSFSHQKDNWNQNKYYNAIIYAKRIVILISNSVNRDLKRIADESFIENVNIRWLHFEFAASVCWCGPQNTYNGRLEHWMHADWTTLPNGRIINGTTAVRAIQTVNLQLQMKTLFNR